jgi:hypothetical protein
MSINYKLYSKRIALSLGVFSLSACSIGGITLFDNTSPGSVLAAGESANTHFFTREMNHDTGISLEAGNRYALGVTILSNWIDKDIENNELDQPLNERGFSNTLMPLDMIGLTRRSREHNWFELMLKQPGCGSALGVSDLSYDDNAGAYNFTASCSGNLQLFVNDTIGMYGNNVGYANISISRL